MQRRAEDLLQAVATLNTLTIVDLAVWKYLYLKFFIRCSEMLILGKIKKNNNRDGNCVFRTLHARPWQVSAPRLTHIVLGSARSVCLRRRSRPAWLTEQKTAERPIAAIYLSSVIARALIFTAVFFWETTAAEKRGNYLRGKLAWRAEVAERGSLARRYRCCK